MSKRWQSLEAILSGKEESDVDYFARIQAEYEVDEDEEETERIIQERLSKIRKRLRK